MDVTVYEYLSPRFFYDDQWQIALWALGITGTLVSIFVAYAKWARIYDWGAKFWVPVFILFPFGVGIALAFIPKALHAGRRKTAAALAVLALVLSIGLWPAFMARVQYIHAASQASFWSVAQENLASGSDNPDHFLSAPHFAKNLPHVRVGAYPPFAHRAEQDFWRWAQLDLGHTLWNWRNPDNPAPEVVHWKGTITALRLDSPAHPESDDPDSRLPLVYCLYSDGALLDARTIMGPMPRTADTEHVFAACPPTDDVAVDIQLPITAVFGTEPETSDSDTAPENE